MAITITVDALISAIRVGNTAVEKTEITRLRDYAIAEISQYVGPAYATIDPLIVNEATVRLVGYLYDMPTIARGAAFANALRNSGAGRMLFRFRVHRAGLATPDEAMAAGIGSVGNPVVNVDVSAGDLVITFNDGSAETHTLPAAGTGVDQTARDLAGAAQTVADAAQTDVDDHESNHPSSYTNAQAQDAARSVVSDWAEQDNGSDIPESKTQRKIFLTTSPINGNTDPGTRSKLHDVHLYVEDTEWQVYEHTGTAPPYLVLRSRLTETAVAVQALINTHAAMPNVHHAGPSLLGSYTGTLSNTAWTATSLTPTAGKAMVGVVYVGANTHNSFTWNGWVMGWYPRNRYDATNDTDGAWRYNFRSSSSQLIYIGRAGDGSIQVRVNGVQTETFEFEFWEL